MQKANNNNFVILMILIAVISFSLLSLKTDTQNASDVQTIATEAYIYGYPLVTMDLTKQVTTNVARPEGNFSPVGQFANLRKYPDASFNAITAPNADTLYSAAWLDLSKEPYILSLPDMDNRYFLMPMLSGWTEVFEVPGKRTTGTKAQEYAIVGPDWTGKLPNGMKEYRAPTNLVWILGRTYSTGTPEDYKAVHALQDKYRLTPLSFYGKAYSPVVGEVNPSIDMKTPVRDQVNNLSGEAYFTKLAELMQKNPPAKDDDAIIARMSTIGIVPGKPFNISTLDPEVVETIKNAPKLGLEAIKEQQNVSGESRNGWLYSTKTGNYGTDYLQRAFITFFGLGANKPQDAIYPLSETDNDGKPYSGKNRYVIRFPKGQMPPVKGFWSLTMYNDQLFFVNNPINRYSISPRVNLKESPDGSVAIYVQHESPGKDKESNWLPAPEGNFKLMFRFYWPEDSIIEGKWNPPAVEKVEKLILQSLN